MVLEIKTFPDNILRKKATVVTTFDEPLHKLLDDMKDTMYNAPGYGLAAPQVGASIRAIVIDETTGKIDGKYFELINPVILEKTGELFEEEGCLSIPGEYAYVKRFAQIRAKYQDRHGNEHEVVATERLARIIQHESDHLEGVLFLDKLPLMKREIIKKHIKKRIQADDYIVTGK